MALTDKITRDQGHHFDPVNNPEDLMQFRQHANSMPSCTAMAERRGLAAGSQVDPVEMPPMPEVAGGENKDRIFNLIVPEISGANSTQVEVSPGIFFPRLRTPDVVVPDRIFKRQMSHGIMIPDGRGNAVEVWSFDDTAPGGAKNVWPAPTMRAVEGEVVHTQLTTRRGTHTIHHHAIEPTAMNDGVGHISFEADGEGYTYQWLASETGTYFYHCHKNTVLHFEMGMYGFLIIDPPVAGAPFADGGPGMIRRANDIVPYDVERIWAVDDIDTRWHSVVAADVDAGVAVDWFHRTTDELGNPTTPEPSPELHRFEPDVFGISGINGNRQGGNRYVIDQNNDPLARVRVVATQGQKILLRLLCAGYNTQVYRIGLDAELIEVDARVLGYGPRQQYSQPVAIPANTAFELTTARRKTLMIDTAGIAPGTYPVTIECWDWVAHKEKLWGIVETSIEITAP